MQLTWATRSFWEELSLARVVTSQGKPWAHQVPNLTELVTACIGVCQLVFMGGPTVRDLTPHGVAMSQM